MTDIVMIAWSPTEARMTLMRQCIDSLQANTLADYRLIIVDNGPAQQTDYIRQIEPDMHIWNKINQGPAASRTIGGRLATSEFIAYVDNDLLFEPGWLTESIGMLETYPAHRLIIAPSRSHPMKKSRAGMFFGWEMYRMVAGYVLVMRTTAFHEIGEWTFGSTGIEDREYINAAFNQGYQVIYWPDGPQVRHAGHKQKTFNPYKQSLVNGKWESKNGM